MQLVSLHPGVAPQAVNENSSFAIPIPQQVTVSAPPSQEELRILREIDPHGLVIER
jgi:glutaconate CoA-transferase subunit B